MGNSARGGGDVKNQTSFTKYENSIVDHVRDSGCHITYVFDPDGDEPAFGYSAGFPETVGQPDIIVFGLNLEVVGHMINETLRQCRSGLQLVDWTELHGLLTGHRCVARRIPSAGIDREYFNSAIWYEEQRTRGGLMASAFQIIWPGAVDGLFPWDDGCNEEVRALQPPLYAARLDS